MTRITVVIGKWKTPYQLIWTTAPANYDHEAALEVYDGSYGPTLSRYLLLPVECVNWQERRNHSGLYQTDVDTNDLTEQHLEEYLLRRLLKLEE